MSFRMSVASAVLSGLFAAVVTPTAAAAERPLSMSEMKPHTPKIPADIPPAPNNPPIRRTNILDVLNRVPSNRKERRHGVTLG